MSQNTTRIIKKYPNRRLYDTEESRYITLAEIRRLVLDKVDFIVIDKKSQKDITRSILLQVITDQEQKGEPVMSRDFLSQVIRSYGNMMPDFVSSYLEQSLKLFVNQQQQVREKVRDVVGVDPVGMVSEMAQKNYARWKSVQDDIFKTLNRQRSRENEKPGRKRTK
ncbi:MAG: polyhydroxyalkanoate synthesis repressor PhaR [Gammaproteobacteria bacterium]|nr:polyhydroxyalkanoate synthesis repressor PhaR [Gammaproteobacteria bacterium]